MASTLSDLDRAHLIHPITEFRVHEVKGPRIVRGGQGIRLELEDGGSVIDGFSGLFNINVGHGRREIAEAVAEQMRKTAYYPSFWDFSTEPAIRLAERLAPALGEMKERERESYSGPRSLRCPLFPPASSITLASEPIPACWVR